MLAQSEQEVVRFWVNPENRGLGGNVKERKKKDGMIFAKPKGKLKSSFTRWNMVQV